MAKLPKFPLSQAFGVSVPRIDAVPNHVFTHHYAQIEDYRFCQDSVILPWFVAQQMTATTVEDNFRVLDLCAGCGVVGFELFHHLPYLKNIDFIEVQTAFGPAFNENKNKVLKAAVDRAVDKVADKVIDEAVHSVDDSRAQSFVWREMNYNRLAEPTEINQYDLIVSNPPYFFAGDGKAAENPVKNRCRFFIDSDLKNYIAGICSTLKPTGSAYFLCKLGGTHGRRSWDQIRLISSMFQRQVEIVADIRGTALVKIRAQPPVADLSQ